ncbi:MAG: hypothetical protein R3C60_04580 [Parvularculaceae bacterium]
MVKPADDDFGPSQAKDNCDAAHIKNVLSPDAVKSMRARILAADWIDGRTTAEVFQHALNLTVSLAKMIRRGLAAGV